MNRVKILLTAVGVLIIVGSALAYSGSFIQKICYVQRPPGGCSATLACTTLANGVKAEIGSNHCYKIVPASTVTCIGQKCPDEATVVIN
jgi:hypothetical protein